MKTRLITFADDRMSKAAHICTKSAIRNNIDEFERFGPDDIDTKFYKKNRAILDCERGPGYWLFKPYFINKTLKKLDEDDHLIYADAGIEFINNIRYVIDRMDQDVWLFGNKFKNVAWCKGNVLDTIIPEWRDGRYDNNNQVQASVIVIKNTEWARSFVAEWLKYCQQPGLIDDSPSTTANHATYSEGRHDQGILCCLQIKHGLKLHHWNAEYNCGAFKYERGEYKDQYPVLFHHHRSRNSLWDQTDELSRKFQKYFKDKYGIQ